jgi:hypothetical protein
MHAQFLCENLKVRDYFGDVSVLEGAMLLYGHPLLGNGLVNKFPRRQILGKQFVGRSHNDRTNVCSSLLGNN